MYSIIETPNLPKFDVSTVLIDYRIDKTIQKSLENNGINIIKTIKCYDLYLAINGHPDIILHHVWLDKIIVAPNVFSYYYDVLQKIGFTVIKGDTWLHRNYPDNIAYNVLRIGDIAFHNTKYTDRKIIEEYEKKNIRLIHVNQGYSKCSVCIVNENSVITSDKKMADIFCKYAIDVLLIEPGGITLEGFDYGFIGGCCGLISKNKIALSGNISYIKNFNKIIEFILNKGVKVEQLSNQKIVDIGSIIPLTY